MEASSQSVRRRIGGRRPSDLLSSRRNAIVVAVICAALAGILIYAFVQQYRHSVNTSATNAPVYVATGLIPRGTAASEVASTGLYKFTRIKSSQVLAGAIADPSVIKGEVAATDIYPGAQLTAADFTRSGVTIGSQLSGTDRAISVPVDAAHGLIGFVQAGDRVDVLSSVGTGGSHGVVNVLAQNVLVLSAPGGGGGGLGGTNNTSEIVLRVTDKQAVSMAFAADNGRVWITLRPPVGAVNTVGSTPVGP